MSQNKNLLSFHPRNRIYRCDGKFSYSGNWQPPTLPVFRVVLPHTEANGQRLFRSSVCEGRLSTIKLSHVAVYTIYFYNHWNGYQHPIKTKVCVCCMDKKAHVSLSFSWFWGVIHKPCDQKFGFFYPLPLRGHFYYIRLML